MTIEQTVEIPASRRLTIEIPPEIPAGRTILAFTPVSAEGGTASDRRLRAKASIEKYAGIAKQLGSAFTSDDLLENRRRDKEAEEAEFRRLFQKDKGKK